MSKERKPQDYELPRNYIENSVETMEEVPFSYWNKKRRKTSRLYQWAVYKWVYKLVLDNDIDSVMDLGCGPGDKLFHFVYPYVDKVYGVDQYSAIENCRNRMPKGQFYEKDLQGEWFDLPISDLVISIDVIEHLGDPTQFLQNIKSVCDQESWVVISTPDRLRLHGGENRKPVNSAHVREWEQSELIRYLEKNGFEVMEVHHFAPIRSAFNLVVANQFLRQLKPGRKWKYNMGVLCKLAQ